MKVAIIGAGSLGQSIAKGLLNKKVVSSLYLTKRNTNVLESFKTNKEVTLTSDNTFAVENSDVIIFAVQPKQLSKIVESVKHLLEQCQILQLQLVNQ